MSYQDDGNGNSIWVNDTITDPTGNWTSNDNGTTWTAIPGRLAAGSISESGAQSDPRSTMANVIRGMSDDFFKTAIPVKDDLIKLTTYNGNKGVIDDLKRKGMEQVGQAFESTQGQIARNTQRYGMQLTPEQQSAQSSALETGKSLAEVDAVNRAGMFQRDLNKQLVSGFGSPSGITK